MAAPIVPGGRHPAAKPALARRQSFALGNMRAAQLILFAAFGLLQTVTQTLQGQLWIIVIVLALVAIVLDVYVHPALGWIVALLAIGCIKTKDLFLDELVPCLALFISATTD